MRLLLALTIALAACAVVSAAPAKGGRGGGGGGGGGGNGKGNSGRGNAPAAAVVEEVEEQPDDAEVVEILTDDDEQKGKGKGNSGGGSGGGGGGNGNNNNKAAKKDGGSPGNSGNKGGGGGGQGKGKGKGPSNFKKPQKKKLSKEEKDALKATCGKKQGGCKRQSEKSQAKRAKAKNMLNNARRRVLLHKKGRAANETLTVEEEEEIENKTIKQMEKVYEAKKAILERDGITDVDPEDTGIWQEDIFLTEQQAERIIRAAEQAALLGEDEDATPPPLPGSLVDGGDTDDETSRRRKRFALYIDEETGARWDKMPIPYVIDEYFDDVQKATIMSAVADIEAKTCIRFQLQEEAPNEAYIYYVKEDYATFCGLSNVGRTGDENYVWLNFDEYCAPQINGTIIHETLHTLGVEHQHARYDRDQRINIKYANIDPQVYDNFAAGDTDSFTSFGVPYDIYSIMHYSANVGIFKEGTVSMEFNHDKPNLRRYFTEVMGQRVGLSNYDADLLRKMYCMGDCRDLEVYCGWWKDIGYCASDTEIMIEYCPATCGFCPNKVNVDIRAKVDLWGYDLRSTTPAAAAAVADANKP